MAKESFRKHRQLLQSLIVLYKILFEYDVETVNLCEADESTLWHRQLGHLSSTGMKKLVKITDGIKLNDVNFSPELCEIRVEEKQTRQPHQTERIRAKRPLQLIHSDLCGPINTITYDGKRYLLTFIDDHILYGGIHVISKIGT